MAQTFVLREDRLTSSEQAQLEMYLGHSPDNKGRPDCDIQR